MHKHDLIYAHRKSADFHKTHKWSVALPADYLHRISPKWSNTNSFTTLMNGGARDYNTSILQISRPALGLTQPPIQVPGFYPGRAWRHHSPPSCAEVKNEWSYISNPPVRLHDMDRECFTSLPSFYPNQSMSCTNGESTFMTQSVGIRSWTCLVPD